MPTHKHAEDLSKTRLRIARRVRSLRDERGWTQQELSRRLDVSQGHLSDLERGDGSFTAEQFLKLLSLFNVPATSFAAERAQPEAELQNALARHGATHLQESSEGLPGDQFEEIDSIVRETLASQSSRQLTALAPVLVSNIDRINPTRLRLRIADAGLERRLGWLLENVLTAVRQELPSLPRGPWRQRCRRAEVVLEPIAQLLAQKLPQWTEDGLTDLLDPGIATKRSIDEVRTSSSEISKRWGIVTRLQPEDFVDALRASRAGR